MLQPNLEDNPNSHSPPSRSIHTGTEEEEEVGRGEGPPSLISEQASPSLGEEPARYPDTKSVIRRVNNIRPCTEPGLIKEGCTGVVLRLLRRDVAY